MRDFVISRTAFVGTAAYILHEYLYCWIQDAYAESYCLSTSGAKSNRKAAHAMEVRLTQCGANEASLPIARRTSALPREVARVLPLASLVASSVRYSQLSRNHHSEQPPLRELSPAAYP